MTGDGTDYIINDDTVFSKTFWSESHSEEWNITLKIESWAILF